MAGTKSPREWQELTDSQMAKRLKMSLEDFYDLVGADEDVLKTYEKIGSVVPRKYEKKKGGTVRRKKGSTVSRRGGGKIMQGYKAGGKV